MKIEAEFCISHGDEIKVVGQRMWIDEFSLPFIDTLYERIGREIGQDCLKAIEDGHLGESAHLVTHPSDH